MYKPVRNIVNPNTVRARFGRRFLAGCLAMCLAGASAAQVVSGDGGALSVVPRQTVAAFDALFDGPRDGQRAVHTKGLLLEARFVATSEAAGLSRAIHLSGSEVSALVRLSNFAGLPDLADGAAAASPRGMSIKFLLPDGGSTDIVAHSYNGFPAATPEGFLGFLRALAAPEPHVLAEFLAAHPAARRFVDTPKPAPESYATETFHGVNAFVFTNDKGKARHVRYRIEPVAGSAHLSAEAAARRGPDYLTRELADRLRIARVAFRLMAQIAGPDDDVVDGSVAWPDDRRMVELGTLTLTGIADDQAAQGSLLFTPLNLVDGISPSRDPLLIARNRAYRISYDRRTGRAIDEGSRHVRPTN